MCVWKEVNNLLLVVFICDRNNFADVDWYKNSTLEILADIYVLAHVTVLFQKAESIDKGILDVKTEKYDSVIDVWKMQGFLLCDGNL